MKIKNLIKMAFVSLTTQSDSNNDYPTVQITHHDIPKSAVRASIYGLVSLPPKGSMALTFAAYGQESTLFAFSDDYQNQFKGLNEGEVLLGNYSAKSYTYFDSEGNAKVFSPEANASLVGNQVYVGSKTVSLIGEQIKLLDALLAALYPSAVGPAGPMASPQKEIIEQIKANYEEINGSFSAETFDS
jgi:hypothetical protein